MRRDTKPLQPDDVTVVTSANIGRESVYDPARGRRGSVVYTGAGVGVGVGKSGGPPDASATVRDRAAIQEELEEKSLPEGKATSAVAGYLYIFSETTRQGQKRSAGTNLLRWKQPIEAAATVGGQTVVSPQFGPGCPRMESSRIMAACSQDESPDRKSVV